MCVCWFLVFLVFFALIFFFCTPLLNIPIELLTKNCITLGDLA